MPDIISTLIIPLALLAGQLWLNQRFKKADEKREEARLETTEKRAQDAQWRDEITSKLAEQDERIDTILKAQCSQTRSDIIHKCHRYIDDRGFASTEEKEALHAEHDEYSEICEANDIINHFIDNLVEQVMRLPSKNSEANRRGEDA